MSQKTYAEERKNPLWKARVAEVIQAAGGECEDCESAKKLEAHHCAYIYGNKPWQYDDSLMMCVCAKSHAKRQLLENAAHVALGKFMRTLSPSALNDFTWDLIAMAARAQFERLSE